LKLAAGPERCELAASPPTRGRGLKLQVLCLCCQLSQSPPTRGRGLKPHRLLHPARGDNVAPHAGAWIETRARCTG
jgi:hypothetical protein